jgi:hypothetical protein
MPSLASVRFADSGFRFQGERDGARIWHTEAGDGIGLYYFALKPDIDADLRSIDKVRQAFRSKVAAAGAAIIAVDTITTDGCLAIRHIIKVPQRPHGMTYIGALLLPFCDFSFVVKAQCQEHGTTGIRDAVVLEEAFRDGRTSVEPDGITLTGWMQDPYDPAIRDGFHWNLSEAREYDARFPNHPLSRLRRLLAHLEATLQVENEVRQSPPYVFAG